MKKKTNRKKITNEMKNKIGKNSKNKTFTIFLFLQFSIRHFFFTAAINSLFQPFFFCSLNEKSKRNLFNPLRMHEIAEKIKIKHEESNIESLRRSTVIKKLTEMHALYKCIENRHPKKRKRKKSSKSV